MNRMKSLVGLFCLLSLLCTHVMAKPVTPYHGGDWAKLLAQAQGHNAIIHIWGFSCGPCVTELPAWGSFMQTHPGVLVAFLEVDQVPEDMTIKTLTQANLIEALHFVSADYFDEYMRYEIDPKWQGELPITLLIDAQGNTQKIRGSVDFNRITRWLSKVTKDD